jgi:hypothetical protein
MRDLNFKNGFHKYQSFNSINFDDKQLYVITKLYYLRDKIARIEDEGVPCIMGKEVLFGSVHRNIRTRKALLEYAKKIKQYTSYLEKYADQFIETINSALAEVTFPLHSSTYIFQCQQDPTIYSKLFPKPVKNNPTAPTCHVSKAKWSPGTAKMIMSNFMMHMLGRNIEYNVRADGPPHKKVFTATLSLPLEGKEVYGQGQGMETLLVIADICRFD